MARLNILVLHRLGSPALAAHFLVKHVYALRNNFPEHNYIYHDVDIPLPAYIRDAEFDAIILDVTFLAIRWSTRAYFEKLLADYSFVASSPALKLAFPQDEYDHHADLDNWMCDWNVDILFSVISSQWDVLFPRYAKQGEIRLAYTGYVDESLVAMPAKPWEQRTIDIGYRTRKLPAYFGRLGQIKWTIGRDVEARASGAGFFCDIKLGDQGRLIGKNWLDFLNDCKFTLGANSGSSLLDPSGEICEAVRSYLWRRPEASFEDLEAHCFPGQDGRYQMTAISPRVLEAAILESCQILVAGEYSGLIKPYEHYIPIAPDASDFDEVARAMRDRDLVSRLIANCRQTILDTDALRYRNAAKAVIELIASRSRRSGIPDTTMAMRSLAERHRRDTRFAEMRHWFWQAVRQPLVLRATRSPRLDRALRWARYRLTGR